jgi:hypothetical protein
MQDRLWGLFRCLLLGTFMVASPGGAGRLMMAELRQLLIKGLDCGFLLAQHLLNKFVALALDRLLLRKELLDIVFGRGFGEAFDSGGLLGHGEYHDTGGNPLAQRLSR